MFKVPYGKAFDLYVPLPKAASTAFAATGDWTPVAGDVKVSIDGGNVANVATLPTAVGGAGSVLWKIPFSAAELTGKVIAVQIVDAALTDQAFILYTTDYASAADPRGVVSSGTLAAGSISQCTLPAAEPTSGRLGFLLVTTGGTGAGQQRTIVGYTAGRVVTPDRNFDVAVDATTTYNLYPGSLPSTTIEVGDAVVAATVEGAYTLKGILRVALAALAGKSTGGGKTFRDAADAKNRIVGTTDGSGNRTAVTLDVTD